VIHHQGHKGHERLQPRKIPAVLVSPGFRDDVILVRPRLITSVRVIHH